MTPRHAVWFLGRPLSLCCYGFIAKSTLVWAYSDDAVAAVRWKDVEGCWRMRRLD